MGLPKKIKKNIDLIDKKTLLPRRHEMADMISMDGTYLPKSLLHADLDRGFLDFVRDELRCVVEGSVVPMVDILLTTQNWSQFTESWDFQNIDKNAEPPFITVIRTPEVKFGTNPATLYNIPNRRMYYYAQVPTWDGQRHGMDIYKIPQPVPVDIKYTVAIVCNRMRELNKFNQIIIEKFASRQAYQVIKGQPALTRVFQMYETDTKVKRKKIRKEIPPTPGTSLFTYPVGNLVNEKTYDYVVNLHYVSDKNVDSYQVFINDDFYGNDITEIQINNGDLVRVVITKLDNTQPSEIIFNEELI